MTGEMTVPQTTCRGCGRGFDLNEKLVFVVVGFSPDGTLIVPVHTICPKGPF